VLTRQTSYTLGKLELFEGSLGRGDEDVSQAFFEIELILSVHRKNQDKCKQDNHDAQNNSDVLAVAQDVVQGTQHLDRNFGQKHQEIEQICDSNHSLSHGILTHHRLSHSVTTHIKSAKLSTHFIVKFPIHEIDFKGFRVEEHLDCIQRDRGGSGFFIIIRKRLRRCGRR